MLGGLPTFPEFKIIAGIEALKKVYDGLPELTTIGRDGIQKVLADHWKDKFPEDNSAIIANAIRSCILLHGEKSGQSLPTADQQTPPASGRSVGTLSTTASAGGSEGKAADPASPTDLKKDRRVRIDAFISKVTESGRKITRKDICTVAGYKDRRGFERFQRVDPSTTKRATDKFNRVLNMTPEVFIRSLDNKLALK